MASFLGLTLRIKLLSNKGYRSSIIFFDSRLTSRWLDVGQVLWQRFYGPRISSRSTKMQKKKKETKQETKQNKKQNKQRRRRRKKHPGPTFSHIDRRGLVNNGSITWMPKTIFFLAGQTIIKTLTVPQESFIKRVDHTSTGIPTLYKLQIHFNHGQDLLSFLHMWNTARYFLSEESCFKNAVHSAKTCMWPYTE